MIDFTTDTATPSTLDLARRLAAVPSYQRTELPRRLRGEWPFPVGQAASTAPAAPEPIRVDPRQYWQRRRAE